MKIVDKFDNEVTELNFDKVFVGDSKELIYYLYNDSEAEISNIELEISTDYPELKEELQIKDYPQNLGPYEKREIKIIWTPSLKIKKGLRARIKITAIENYLP